MPELPAGPWTHQLLDTHFTICKSKIRPSFVLKRYCAAYCKDEKHSKNLKQKLQRKYQTLTSRKYKLLGEYQRAGPDTGMVFSCQPSKRGAGVLLACPDTELVCPYQSSKKLKWPSHNNSTEEKKYINCELL